MRAATFLRLIALLRRTLAAGSALLVFVLGLCAVSPALHQQLHDGSDLLSTDQCAIVLFAGGVALPVALIAVAPPVIDWQESRPTESLEVLLDSPRYLLQPERGPPVA